MGDLISRKALMKEFGIDEDTPDVAKILIAVKLRDIEKIINRQPIAYDVDKVVEKLEKEQEDAYYRACKSLSKEEGARANALLDAIEIVKGAVKDE